MRRAGLFALAPAAALFLAAGACAASQSCPDVVEQVCGAKGGELKIYANASRVGTGRRILSPGNAWTRRSLIRPSARKSTCRSARRRRGFARPIRTRVSPRATARQSSRTASVDGEISACRNQSPTAAPGRQARRPSASAAGAPRKGASREKPRSFRRRGHMPH
jgi:hypothetical protein